MNITLYGIAHCRHLDDWVSITWNNCKRKAAGRRGVPTSCNPFTPPTDMSFSDFYPSELSDITSSEDDEEFVPSLAKRSGAKNTKRNQLPYTIPNPLRPPRSTSYSVRALYGLPFLSISPIPPHPSIRTNRRWIDRLRSRLSKRYAFFLSYCPPMSHYIPTA